MLAFRALTLLLHRNGSRSPDRQKDQGWLMADRWWGMNPPAFCRAPFHGRRGRVRQDVLPDRGGCPVLLVLFVAWTWDLSWCHLHNSLTHLDAAPRERIGLQEGCTAGGDEISQW